APDGPRRWSDLPAKAPLERYPLGVQAAHRRPDVREQIPDLNGDRFPARDPLEDDVDRPRPEGDVIDRQLGLGDPPAAGGHLDHETLAAEVLDVPRLVRTGHSLEKRRELLSDRRGDDRPGLDG